MKKKSSEHQHAVAAVKAQISPTTPCVRADAEGYCTGPCAGALCFKCGDYKPVTAVTVATQEIVLERPQGATAADRIKHDIYMSRKHSAYSMAYFARAGWQLLQEKFKIGYGGWGNWCKENLGFSKDTADRYIHFYNSTVGKWRAAQGLADTMVAELTDKMIEAATAGLEYETGTQAMIALGIIKRNPDHGGKREGAGRPKKDTNAPLAESDVDGELCAEEGRDLLEKLAGWALGADDGFGTLPDRELAKAVDTLGQMLKRAREIRDAREAGR